MASLSGFADLKESFYPGQTVSSAGMQFLVAAGRLSGRPGPVLDAAFANLSDPAADHDAFLSALSPERSAATKVDAINAGGAAVLIAHATGDSFFAPNTMTDFFERLTVPKKLLLAGGDHSSNDLAGLIGLPNDAWASTVAWLDRYLRGVANGVDTGLAVKATTANSFRPLQAPTVAALAPAVRTTYLTKPAPRWAGDSPTGALAAAPAAGWSSRIDTGWDTVANSGTALISGMLQGSVGLPVIASMPFVNRTDAGVWMSEPVAGGATVAGAPRLRLTVTPSRAQTTLLAYLYDIDAVGMGSLICAQPVSLRDATPGVPRTIEMRLQHQEWDVPAGHRFALVVDTVDPRWASLSSKGGWVTFSSPAGAESSLTIPPR